MPVNEKLLTELSIKQYLKKDELGKWDLTDLYKRPEVLKMTAALLAAPYVGKVDFVAAPESLGYIFAGLMAAELNVGLIPIRDESRSHDAKDAVVKASYLDHNNKIRTLQAKKGLIPKNSNILLVDQWVETAATVHCCQILIEEAGSRLAGITAIGANKNDATESMLISGLLSSGVIV